MTRLSISILLVSILVGCTSNASSPPGSSSATLSIASGLVRVYERGGTIFVVGKNGSPVALTRGSLPKLSPTAPRSRSCGTPADPHAKPGR